MRQEYAFGRHLFRTKRPHPTEIRENNPTIKYENEPRWNQAYVEEMQQKDKLNQSVSRNVYKAAKDGLAPKVSCENPI